MIFQKAISSGSPHGLELKAGKLKATNGDCLFQAIINNIENRPFYTNKTTESDKDLRIRCITKAQQEAHLIPCIKTDTTISEWNKLKQPGRDMQNRAGRHRHISSSEGYSQRHPCVQNQ